MLTLEDYLATFIDSLFGHVILVVYLFAIMGERDWRRLRRLPALLPSPVLAALLAEGTYALIPDASVIRLCVNSGAVLLMCTLWVRWTWGIGPWGAFAAVCLGGVFQVAVTCLSHILFMTVLVGSAGQFPAALAISMAVSIATAALLHRLRFGSWFRLLLEDGPGQRWTALLLFGMEAAMETFFILQHGVRPEYLVFYYLLVMVTAALAAGLVIYLAQRLDAVRMVKAQGDVIAQQQLYERDLESIRREVRSFRHDCKNLLAGLSEQADAGELDQLRAALRELEAGFDRRIGEKILSSTQLGNVRVPQMRSLLLSKLAAMAEKGIDCSLEAFYPVERVEMDVWDFTRCLGILLDNAAEAAAETKMPWVEVVLLAQGEGLSLRVSNPYTGTVEPDKLWTEGFSTKGEGRGLGLPGYQRILAGYANVTWSTSWAGSVFVQELTVGCNHDSNLLVRR